MTSRARPLLLALALLIAAAPPAGAQDPAPTFASDGVEFVRNVPMAHPPDGGRLVGRYFYATSRSELTIFDVADPENPVLLSTLASPPMDPPLPDAGWPTGYQEDVDTNGRILVRTPFGSPLMVVDVADPRAPRIVSTLENWGGHTISCVLDCTWVYSSAGAVLDLRDPRNPQHAGNWEPEGMEDLNPHDVTEVAPGIVLTASDPMLLLDAREDPLHPTVLATTEVPEPIVHGTHWPNQMQDRFALVGAEGMYPNCTTTDGPAMRTYDTTDWRENERFALVDTYRVPSGGTVTDGRNVTATYCGHWADPHPRFSNGGLIAIAWYEHGTRFVRVRPDGGMEEAGWFLPLDSYAWSAHWISDRVVYSVDQYRGIDVVRFTREIPAGSAPPAPAAQPPAPAAPAAARKPSVADLIAMPPTARCAGRRGLTLRVREPGAVRRLEARIGRGRPIGTTGRTLRLRRIPRRRFTVTAVVTAADGRRLTRRATYRPCR
jgi:hypothetical protein